MIAARLSKSLQRSIIDISKIVDDTLQYLGGRKKEIRLYKNLAKAGATIGIPNRHMKTGQEFVPFNYYIFEIKREPWTVNNQHRRRNTVWADKVTRMLMNSSKKELIKLVKPAGFHGFQTNRQRHMQIMVKRALRDRNYDYQNIK